MEDDGRSCSVIELHERAKRRWSGTYLAAFVVPDVVSVNTLDIAYVDIGDSKSR